MSTWTSEQRAKRTLGEDDEQVDEEERRGRRRRALERRARRTLKTMKSCSLAATKQIDKVEEDAE